MYFQKMHAQNIYKTQVLPFVTTGIVYSYTLVSIVMMDHCSSFHCLTHTDSMLLDPERVGYRFGGDVTH